MRHQNFDIINQEISVTVTDNEGGKLIGFATRDTDMMTISRFDGFGNTEFVTSMPFSYDHTPAGAISVLMLNAVSNPMVFSIEHLRVGDFLYSSIGAYWGIVTRTAGSKPDRIVGDITWFKWAFESGDVLHDHINASSGMSGIDIVLRKTVQQQEVDIQYVVECELPHRDAIDMARRMSRSISARNFQTLYVTPKK